MKNEGEVIVFGFKKRLTYTEQNYILERVNHLDWVVMAERLTPERSNEEVRRHCIARIKTGAVTAEEAASIIGQMAGVEYAERPASRQL